MEEKVRRLGDLAALHLPCSAQLVGVAVWDLALHLWSANRMLTVVVGMVWVFYNLIILGGAVASIGRKQTGTPIAPRDDDARSNCPRRWSPLVYRSRISPTVVWGSRSIGQAQILEGQKVNLLLKRGQQEYVFPAQVARVMVMKLG